MRARTSIINQSTVFSILIFTYVKSEFEKGIK